MVIIDGSLQYLEDLVVDKKKFLLHGTVESVEVTYVGEKRYSIDVLDRALSIMFCHSQLTIV